jgi:hypothetical protein
VARHKPPAADQGQVRPLPNGDRHVARAARRAEAVQARVLGALLAVVSGDLAVAVARGLLLRVAAAAAALVAVLLVLVLLGGDVWV